MATDAAAVVDAHVHVASGDEHRFPRSPSGLGSEWWRNPSGGSELTSAMDDAGVDRAVVVQAVGVYGYDCTYAAEVVSASGGRLALVGAVDMASPTADESLAALFEQHRPVGVRLFGVGADGAGWLSSGVGRSVWAVASELGITLVPTLFSDHLSQLRELIEAQPDVIVALDHCAFPDLGGPRAMADLCAMADLPALSLKVTSHNLDHTEGDPAPVLEPLAEAFGPERLCWGSDHPQHGGLTYDDKLELARRAARQLDAAGRARFLGGTARELWWREHPDPSVRAVDHPGGIRAR
ncbi:MAG: amidohydrolase family protein [Actinomycetota bacterium]